MVWNRATTRLPGAQGVALFLVFHPDEAGKGLEGPGKDEEEDGFQVGSTYPGWGSSAAEKGDWGDEVAWDGLPGDAEFTSTEHSTCTACGAMGRFLPWNKPKFPRTGHLFCGSFHAAGASCPASLMEMSRTISTAQKPASEREWSETGKGSHEAGNRNKEKVSLMGMLKSTVSKSPGLLQLRNNICLMNANKSALIAEF